MTIDTPTYTALLADSYRALIIRWIVFFAGYMALGLVLFFITRSPAVFAVAIPLMIAVAFVPLVRRRLTILSALPSPMLALAEANDLHYIRIAKPNYQKHFQPATAQLGIYERHEQIIKGKYGAYNFQAYVDTYRNPFSYQYTRSKIRVFQLKLPKEFPHIYLINRQSGNKALSLVPRHFDDAQRIALEGDFNDYFTVYTHRNTRTQALSLLAPNVMRTLMDSNKKFDIEFLGGYLYIYTRDVVPTAGVLTETFDALDALLKHLEHRLKSWKFVLPNNRHFPYMTSRPGFGTVTFGGRYFNASWAFIVLYTGYSGFKVFADPETWQLKVAIIVISDIAMITLLLIFRKKYQLSRRNRPL